MTIRLCNRARPVPGRAFLCLVVAAGLSSPALGQASFQGLGFIPGSTPNESYAYAVSADGVTVVGQANSPQGEVSMRWTLAQGMQNLGGMAPYASTPLRAVSADGSVAAGAASRAINDLAIRWTSGSGLQSLGFLAGDDSSTARGISGDGTVIVGGSGLAGSPAEAVRWVGGTPSSLGVLTSGGSSIANGISSDGLVIVGQAISLNGFEAFRWTSGGGMVGLGDLPGGLFSSTANAANSDGSVIVGQGRSSQGQEAFRWTSAGGGTMQALGDLPGGSVNSTALAVSADGAVVVGMGSVAGAIPGLDAPEAMIWDAGHGMRDLKDVLTAAGVSSVSGWTLQQATGISADGTVIVGYGLDPLGQTQAWITHFPRACYANCDGSTTPPVLNVNDFVCFQTEFAASDPAANCDGSVNPPILTVNDFVCFQTRFAAGCP